MYREVADKIKAIMGEDPEIAESISKGLADKILNGLEARLKKDGHFSCDENPSGLSEMRFGIIPDMKDEKCIYHHDGCCRKGLAGTACELEGCVAHTVKEE